MYLQNSLVSLMAQYHDSDDEEEPQENIRNNLNFLNLNSPQSNNFSPASQFELDNDISLPPVPIASCEPALQEKITKFYQKIEAGQLDMNQWIQEHKEFRNPSIYEKLIGYCNIDELGTNYPTDRFDPSQWPEDSYYDKLAEEQSKKMKKLLGKK